MTHPAALFLALFPRFRFSRKFGDKKAAPLLRFFFHFTCSTATATMVTFGNITVALCRRLNGCLGLSLNDRSILQGDFGGCVPGLG